MCDPCTSHKTFKKQVTHRRLWWVPPSNEGTGTEAYGDKSNLTSRDYEQETVIHLVENQNHLGVLILIESLALFMLSFNEHPGSVS